MSTHLPPAQECNHLSDDEYGYAAYLVDKFIKDNPDGELHEALRQIGLNIPTLKEIEEHMTQITEIVARLPSLARMEELITLLNDFDAEGLEGFEELSQKTEEAARLAALSAGAAAASATEAAAHLSLAGIRTTPTHTEILQDGNVRIQISEDGIGFNGAEAVPVYTLPPAATDEASIITLVNAIRSSLIASGLAE